MHCTFPTRRPGVALACIILLLAGCTAAPPPPPTTQASATTNPAAADLDLALKSLRKLAESDSGQPGEDKTIHPGQRTIFYLNQWISSDPGAAKEWKADRLLDSLPRAFRNTPGLERLARLQFSLDDVDYLQQIPWLDDISYLQQTLWLHDIAHRVRRQDPAVRLRPWLKEVESSIGLPESEQLGLAERLLDWTARNIQLDPLPEIPRDPQATAGSTETVMPSARGIIGPGYGHLPIETLIYGRGDAHERARIFILLCRQVGIDAVMLGFPLEQSTVRRGWLPSALIGGKLYLFDTALGLPIPGPEGKGIATLDQVTSEPALLKQADVGGAGPYPITEKDLKLGPIALIDAEPAALSRRMHLLQAAMPASLRLAVATQPAEIDAKLRRAGVSGVSLWAVPFDAILYRFGHFQQAMSDPQVASELRKLAFLFSPMRPLVKGRNLHLQGRFENEEQKFGARSLYLQCRKPDREIQALVTNEFYRKAIGLEGNLPQESAQKEAALKSITEIAYEEKFHATFWLGLTYFEAGKYDAAIQWLSRVVEVSPPSPWTAAARHNLARCYEELGRPELARQWFESDHDSPQRHGNLLRASWLSSSARGEQTTAEKSAGRGD
jgi:tetratricopeptide (TPR) repeat protein